MDERFIEQASAVEQAERDSALNAISRTLARPGQPYCEECGDAIAPERRKANPSAIRCIHCQSAFEHHHNTTGGPL
jgi:phage/conjugal plasmid C-4 type zinc finger TraR family protein